MTPTDDAGAAVGVSSPVAYRWFRNGGGMPRITLTAPTGRCISLAGRKEIAIVKGQDVRVREIARQAGRHPSTISRELRRNAATRGAKSQYRASVAQCNAAKHPKKATFLKHE